MRDLSFFLYRPARNSAPAGFPPHAARNNVSLDLTNGSRLAKIHTGAALEDRIPRLRSSSLPVMGLTKRSGGVAKAWERFVAAGCGENSTGPIVDRG